jgi:hypothetical protein
MIHEKSTEPKFTVLNPEGIKPEIEIHPLSPRLITLKGKTVNVINMHGGTESLVESIAADLQKAVPDCHVVLIRPEGGQGGPPLSQQDWDKMLACDAAIIGHNH